MSAKRRLRRRKFQKKCDEELATVREATRVAEADTEKFARKFAQGFRQLHTSKRAVFHHSGRW